jgi:predicted transcriptional regulator
MTEEYQEALRKALSELSEVERQAQQIELRRATLRQSVAVLQTLAGGRVDHDLSVTDSILTVLQANPGPLPTAQIVQRLTSMGHTPQPSSVATLLSRLAQQGKIMKTDEGYAFITIDLENPKNLTDAVMLAMTDTGDGESVSAAQLVSYLAQLQMPVGQHRIEAILSQLSNAKNRYIEERVKPDGSGVSVYHLLGPARSRQARTNARKRIVDNLDKIMGK